MKPVVFIDGREGTTGLQIYDRLAQREDISLLLIDEEKRKDPAARRECLNAADLVFLCLPDQAAREAVAMIDNPNTRVIDASTAHRTQADWVYGLPEVGKRRQAIAAAKRVANPGCHATGFLAGVAPLVELGVLPRDYPVTCVSLTGYSGGGKKMIADYEEGEKGLDLYSPRIYALSLQHKHIPEMTLVSGLAHPPVFTPVVDDYYKGMATTIQLHNRCLPGQPTSEDVRDALAEYYQGEALITVLPFGSEQPMIAANSLAGKDGLQLIVDGSGDRTLITALFDNLGKGASGAAVQNMNLMLGFGETLGLSL